MWPNPQEIADLVTFTGEIFSEKIHFLCSVVIALSNVYDGTILEKSLDMS